MYWITRTFFKKFLLLSAHFYLTRTKNTEIIHTIICILIHSSFCVLNFMFHACRPNSATEDRSKWNAERVCLMYYFRSNRFRVYNVRILYIYIYLFIDKSNWFFFLLQKSACTHSMKADEVQNRNNWYCCFILWWYYLNKRVRYISPGFWVDNIQPVHHPQYRHPFAAPLRIVTKVITCFSTAVNTLLPMQG